MPDAQAEPRRRRGRQTGSKNGQAVATVNRDQILDRLAAGELVCDISPSLDITRQAISQVLAGDKDYVQARKVGAALRVERHYGELVEANDQISLARARECFRAASWFAEREFPEVWGNRTQVTVNHRESIDSAQFERISDLLAQLAPSTLQVEAEDAELVVDPQQTSE